LKKHDKKYLNKPVFLFSWDRRFGYASFSWFQGIPETLSLKKFEEPKMNLKQVQELLIVDNDKIKVLAHLTNSVDNPKDCIDVEERKGQGKSSYSVYTLHLKLDDRHVLLKNLFARQLNELIATYGENTENWVNLPVEVSGKQDGKYFNAVVKPTKEFLEEELN